MRSSCTLRSARGPAGTRFPRSCLRILHIGPIWSKTTRPRRRARETPKETRGMSDVLIETLEDGLLTLTFNRPERRNALNPEILDALVDAATRAATNPAVTVVMLTGAGGTFCVGGDVKAMAAREGAPIAVDDRTEDL